MRVAVYCASSTRIGGHYLQVAGELGRLLAERGHTVVFGGTDLGMMGALARAAQTAGGAVIGVIPQRFVDHGIAYRSADTLLVTATMAERKSRMESLANAYIALAGGYGTLDELAEVITLKQAHYLDGAIVIVNTDGFFRHLLAHLEHLTAAGFASDAYRGLYAVVETPAEAVAYIEAWVPRAYPEKCEPPAP